MSNIEEALIDKAVQDACELPGDDNIPVETKLVMDIASFRVIVARALYALRRPAHGEGVGALSFVEMLRLVIDESEYQLKEVARQLGISPQYLHDLKEGRRLPSVEVTNKICDWMGRGPIGRSHWHQAAARAHGWDIDA